MLIFSGHVIGHFRANNRQASYRRISAMFMPLDVIFHKPQQILISHAQLPQQIPIMYICLHSQRRNRTRPSSIITFKSRTCTTVVFLLPFI